MYSDQAQFEDALARASCAVLVSGASSGALALQLVRSVRGRAPNTPLVAVVPRDAELVRAISKYVDEVVWDDEEHALCGACARAQRGSLRDVSLQIRDAQHLTPLLRTALTIALDHAAPPRSIGDLTAAIGSHRTSLDRHWRRLNGDPELKLQHFVDWLILLHAMGLKGVDVSWSRVAAMVGTSPRSLRLLAKRLTHHRLGELSAVGIDSLLPEFLRFLHASRVLIDRPLSNVINIETRDS